MRYNVRLLPALTALSLLPMGAAVAQTSPAAAQSPTVTSCLASGPTSDADIARLRAAITKLPDMELLDLTVRPGGVRLHVRGMAGTLLAAAAKSAGFDLRPTPLRSYLASGLSTTADTTGLREALGNMDGIEKVEISGPAGGATVRVLGDVKAGALAATAKSAGFDLRRITSYVASGPSTPAILTRLQETLKKASGVTQVDLRGVAGGAMLRIQGTMEDEALFAAAKSAGFRFRPLTDPVGGRFRVSGTTDADAEGKLRKALQAVAGIGELQIQTNSEGAQLSVSGGTTIPEVIVAVAKAAGFDLRPADPVAASFDSADVERNTPPAPNDRILEDVTRVGDLAPDFTLGAKDGKSKITLSEFRDKKPVVLIFGSYT